MNDGPRIYGILGGDIDYSLSPEIYNTIFMRKNINAVYNLYNVNARRVPAFVGSVRALGVSGFNVTTPHKQSVIPLLDDLDKNAGRTSSVNLVLNRKSRLMGYNTDVVGIKHSIESELEIDASHRIIVMFGSGGAANSVFHYLSTNGAREVHVVHRTVEGKRRFENFLNKVRTRSRYVPLLSNGHRMNLPDHQLCINCTPAPIDSLLTRRALRTIGAIFELRYGNFPLLNRKHLRGNHMLAVQAASNLKLMEGLEVPYSECMKIINRAVRDD